MRSSLTASFSLHIAAIILATFGLPELFKPPVPVESPPVVVELVTLANETNVVTRPRDPEPPKPEQAKPEPKPEPKPVETPPPTPPKAEPQPEPPQAVAPPEPKPEPKPEVKPEPKPEPKPQPPRELANTTPAKKPKAPQEDFDSVLKNLAKSLPQQKSEPKAAEKKAESKSTFDEMMAKAIPSNRKSIGDPTKPLTMTEQDLIRNIFNKAMQRCWNAPVGAKDAKDLVINIRVALAEDGTVTRVSLEDSTLGKSEFWRAAAESAMRAIRVCSPYSELPRNLYDSWRDSVLSFNPRELLGG